MKNGRNHEDDSLESRFNQTMRNVQELLKGRIVPGNFLTTRRSDVSEEPSTRDLPINFGRSLSENDAGASNRMDVSADEHNDQQKHNLGTRSTDLARVAKFNKVLSSPSVIVEHLRELAWSGVPPYMRPNVWRLLIGYSPSNSSRRDEVLRRKRSDYLDSIARFYQISDNERSDDEITMLRQISLDCPRTVPNVTFFQQPQVQKSLERILYIWYKSRNLHYQAQSTRLSSILRAIRHPASGYVQGINDLATPFLVVFLSEFLQGEVEKWSISDVPQEKILDIEADCYWCLSKLLDCMQDHYTFAQPGIQRLVFKLKELVRRIDDSVAKHIEDEGLEFLQFAFRWFNCLMIREIPFHLVTRLWDTYLSEGDALPDFLVYISASFLLNWAEELKSLDFQEMVMFLQHLPTGGWSHQELEMVLSRAFMWYSLFHKSPSHLIA